MTEFKSLSVDLMERILCLLPIPTLIRASTVCKLWYSIISSSTFSSSSSSLHPWFFLYGLHNTSSKNNQSFAFDPISNLWFRLPSNTSFSNNNTTSAAGFLFTTAPTFSFSPVLSRHISTTSPLHYSRLNPLLGVFYSSHTHNHNHNHNHNRPTFIVVGGVRFVGNLVDIEDRLAVEMYNPDLDSWAICPPLPSDFPTGFSSSSLSSALFKGRFYVFGINSSFVSSFDLESHVWSSVQTLRPPGVSFSFLISCKDRLVLAGICNSQAGSSFNLWRIDENTMEFSEFAIMPQDLLYSLFDSDEDDKFASLKCVGLGDLIYVFNEDYHKRYPACVCEITTTTTTTQQSGGGKCKWRRVPQLPSPVNKFHQVISFCSTVSLHSILRGRGGDAGAEAYV